MATVSTESIFSALEHDLKSPVVGILSVCALLKLLPDDKITKKTLEESVRKIEGKAYFSIRLLEDLSLFLNIAKLSHGKRETINLSTLFQDIHDLYGKELSISTPKNVVIRGNKAIFRKILELLVQQTIHDQFRNGEVQISVKAQKNILIGVSYALSRDARGASQDIESGKEKFYYYFLTELVSLAQGKMEIMGSDKSMRTEVIL